MANERMTITEVADKIGVTPKTITRWEKAGKVRKPKRDWRGWRTYDQEDFRRIVEFKETLVEDITETEKRGVYAQATV